MQRLLIATALGFLLCCAGPATFNHDQTAGAAPPDGGAPRADAGVSDAGAATADAGAPAADAGEAPADGGIGGSIHGWVTLHHETFETLSLPAPAWQPDSWPDDGPFSDNGVYFKKQGIVAPAAYRISAPFGEDGWLTAESYTRSSDARFGDRLSVVIDPADPANHALRLASPAHTDATVIRPTHALPAKYRVSVRVGFADFGDGKPGLNGYRGGETAEPWLQTDSLGQNGFYWLTILDAQPRPHNNVWIHHHRKVVMDSDNNTPPWMEMFDGNGFVPDGSRPLMMIALDGTMDSEDLTGPPFLSYAEGAWQPSGKIRMVDSYLPGQWYQASIERDGDQYTMEVSGTFARGGQQTYRASIDAAKHCIWHYNNAPGTACAKPRYSSALGPGYPDWPNDGAWADWFMFGDPHENFYEGQVLYDDVKLETWRE